MAALASSAVAVNRGWYEVATGTRLKVKELILTLTGQGGASNTIDASTLGFSQILDSSIAQKSDDAGIVLSRPSYDGSKLFLYEIGDSVYTDNEAPADITGTYKLIVKGT